VVRPGLGILTGATCVGADAGAVVRATVGAGVDTGAFAVEGMAVPEVAREVAVRATGIGVGAVVGAGAFAIFAVGGARDALGPLTGADFGAVVFVGDALVAPEVGDFTPAICPLGAGTFMGLVVACVGVA